MTPRDLVFTGVGAALSALTFAGIHRAHADVPRAAVSPPSATAIEVTAAHDEALTAANARLAEDLRACTRQLASAASNANDADAATAPPADETSEIEAVSSDMIEPTRDPTRAEWREMAKSGSFRYRTVCSGAADHATSDDFVQRLGLSPDDAAIVSAAFTASHDRTWTSVKSTCMQLLGVSAEGAEVLGQDACMQASIDLVDRSGVSEEGAMSAFRPVAEIRGGMREPPRAGEAILPLTKMMLDVTGESDAIRADLAHALGPDEAARVVDTWDCWEGGEWGGGDGP